MLPHDWRLIYGYDHSPTATREQLRTWQAKYTPQEVAEKFLFLQKWCNYK
jgi:hypothetical protein